ncbi:uncharacterized protein [Miscanthus floridulus]|uniref:uncharacterized protein n=1 Tax=Miscanthus floridulus TaxID=154761 RepID=UPI00345764DE
MVEAAARSTDLASPQTDPASTSSPPTDPSASGDGLDPLHPRASPLDHPCAAAADGAWCSTTVTGAAGWSTVGIRRRRGSICPPPPANGSTGKKVEGRRIRPSPTAGEPATPAPLSAPGLRASGPRREAGHAREAAPPLRNAAPPANKAEPPHLRAERAPRRAPPPCQEE